MVELEDKLSPNTITGVVDTGDCYVVSACAPDGFPLLQPPYKVSRNGEIGLYDIFDERMKQKLENGRVLYTDYTPLKAKPVKSGEAQSNPHHADGSSGSGNWGHKGVPGQLGGSAPGGGIAHRTGSKETGYSSAAKERAKAKSSSSATSGGSSSSAGGKKSGESSGGSSSRMSVSELQERHFTAIEKMAVSK